MKSLTKKALLGSGLMRLAAGFRGPGAAILMYHSVMENPVTQENMLGGIVHSRDVFRGQMQLLARSYRPVTLNQIKTFARGEALPHHAVVITFDDGYADNYEIAAPILKEVGIPATFYVTVDCVAKGLVPWPARLRFAFRTTRKQNWKDSAGTAWALHDNASSEAAYLFSCDECCKLTGLVQEKYVSQVELDLDARVPSESSALMMNYEQVRGLARQGHIIGSHTMSHPNLAHVSPPELRAEMIGSKSTLERELESTVQHFSYPCPALPPNWSDATVEESRKAGYETAVTTDNGVTRRGDDALRLKRLPPTKTVEGLKWNLERAFVRSPV